MRVAGFTFIKNAVEFDYPIVEAIRSILPLCEKVFVAVGDSRDATLELVEAVSPEKVVVLKTVWDESLREGGRVLAAETDKALDFLIENGPFDWAVYAQGDEIFDEKGHSFLLAAMEKWRGDAATEGLLLPYRHFYGSYDFVADSRRWYRNEVRVVRPDRAIRSWLDAQGFRKNGQKLAVRKVPEAFVHHYGWVKSPERQMHKVLNFNKLWHPDAWIERRYGSAEAFDYGQIDSLQKFEGEHPDPMRGRVAAMNWKFDFDPTRRPFSLKNRLSSWLEKTTGWLPGERKNYRLLS